MQMWLGLPRGAAVRPPCALHAVARSATHTNNQRGTMATALLATPRATSLATTHLDDEPPPPPPQVRRQVPLAATMAMRQPVFPDDDDDDDAPAPAAAPEAAPAAEEPIPASESVPAPNALAGEVIVLSGQFPSKGAGEHEDDLKMGKNELRAELVACGARVVDSFSGKVTLLVIGINPGMSKHARAVRDGIKIVDLDGIERLKRGEARSAVPTPAVSAFSAGYKRPREQ